MRDGGFGLLHDREIPSFSSSLLDEIYRSMDKEGGLDLPGEQGFYANMICGKKQTKCDAKAAEVEKIVNERETIQRRQVYPEPEKKPRDRYFDHDGLFFSSTSTSPDSSSNGFSSSDTESAYSGVKTRASCFVPLSRPKPVRTSLAARPDRTRVKTELSPFQEHRKHQGFDRGDEGVVNSKSRALKIYSNLKKMKQPISPGGKLASFINSLLAASYSPRKDKQSTMSSVPSSEEENLNGKLSACSPASSLSRSCLSKHAPAKWEKLRNGSKRTVQFYPMSVILDEDSRTCGQKSLHQECKEVEKENLNKARSGRNPGKNVHRKTTDETWHNPRMDRSSQREETARELLRNYHRNKKIEKTTTMTSRGSRWNSKNDDDRDYEDDAASCTSSDLFELDHLSVLGFEELPVYGTTHVGLIM